MLKPYWSFMPAFDGPVSPSINVGRNLDKIGCYFDWQRFEKYLSPANTNSSSYVPACPPLVLFRALLVQQWFTLIPVEYESCLSDSLACRRFIGLHDGEPPPSFEAVAALRRRLKNREIALPVFEEFNRQVERLGLTLAGPSGRDRPAGDPAAEIATPRVLQPYESDHWIALTEKLGELWNRRRGSRPLPTLKDIKLSDIAEFEDFAILMRRIRSENDFRYEFAGNAVIERNGSNPVGTTISQKRVRNLRIFGHAGLQAELQGILAGASRRGEPKDTCTFFMNSLYCKSEMLVTVAPLLGEDQDVAMLLGVALIEPVRFV
jgi:hypothetical protein